MICPRQMKQDGQSRGPGVLVQDRPFRWPIVMIVPCSVAIKSGSDRLASFVQEAHSFHLPVTPLDFGVSEKRQELVRCCRWSWICGRKKNPRWSRASVNCGIRIVSSPDSPASRQQSRNIFHPPGLRATMMDDTANFCLFFSTSFLLRSGSGYCRASVHREPTSSTKLRDGGVIFSVNKVNFK
jgi:hypothetical protein